MFAYFLEWIELDLDLKRQQYPQNKSVLCTFFLTNSTPFLYVSSALCPTVTLLATIFLLDYFNNLLTGCQQISVANLRSCQCILCVAFLKHKLDHVSVPFIKFFNGISFPTGWNPLHAMQGPTWLNFACHTSLISHYESCAPYRLNFSTYQPIPHLSLCCHYFLLLEYLPYAVNMASKFKLLFKSISLRCLF